MGSRAVHALLIVLASLGAVLASCSSDSKAPPTTAPNDDGGRDANRPAIDPGDGSTPPTCQQECEAQHPTAVPKDEAINGCWADHCASPCVDQEPGDAGHPGKCKAPVVTISAACDNCTTTYCCAAWDDCFNDPECAALNACYQQCD